MQVMRGENNINMVNSLGKHDENGRCSYTSGGSLVIL